MLNQPTDIPANREVVTFTGENSGNFVKASPARLYLELTNTCMHHCIICPKSNPKNSFPYNLKFSEVKHIILNTLEHQPIKSVTLSGGEPLLHPEIIEIINWIASLGIHITLLTNLHMGSSHLWSNLAGAKKYLHVITALHSTKSSLHDQITNVAGSYQTVLEGIDELLNYQIDISIKVIISYQTCCELPGILNLILERWGRRIRLYLHGLDLHGMDINGIHMLPISYPQEGILLNHFLRFAQTIYGKQLSRYISISEYPLCWIDRIFHHLVLKSYGELLVSSSNERQLILHIHKENSCAQHSPKCRNCGVSSACPGIWYSVFRFYGDHGLQSL